MSLTVDNGLSELLFQSGPHNCSPAEAGQAAKHQCPGASMGRCCCLCLSSDEAVWCAGLDSLHNVEDSGQKEIAHGSSKQKCGVGQQLLVDKAQGGRSGQIP